MNPEKELSEELLKSFRSRAYRHTNKLNRLPPSQQFEIVGDINSGIKNLTEETKAYEPMTRLSYLALVPG